MNAFNFNKRFSMQVAKMFALATFLLCGLTVFAQTTTSSISGKVTDENGEGLIGATVVATHVPSGTRYGTSTNDAGRYILPAVRVGGPYTVIVTYTGFENREDNNVYLSLGQTFRHDVNLSENAALLGEVAIVAKRDIMNTEKNGASTSISEDEINVLPTVARDLTDFTRLTPQANITGDNQISIAGANNRYNSVFIDGAVNNDVFGLAASGTNGGQTGISPISPDAIEQFQVVVAPYDVKLSGFSGGGINAVTRSGTNEFDGSVYYFMRNEKLAGFRPTVPDTASKAARRLADFTAKTYGFRIGGPVIKDKLFFFVNAELQRDETPQPFQFSNYRGNATEAQVQQMATKLQSYGYEPGGFLDQVDKLEGTKILARVDFNLSENHKLMLRHHYTKGTSTYAQNSSNGTLRFGNNGIYFPSTTNSTALELNSIVGERASNHLILGYTSVDDDRDPLGNPFPGIEIQDGPGSIVAGSELFSTANSLTQKIYTLTDNFNLYLGKHNVTIGTHNEFFDMYNLFIRRAYGYYRWSNIEDFLTDAAPNRYRRSYSLLPGDLVEDGAAAAASFKSMQLGLYVQDEYSFSDKFRASLGLRVDVPMFLDDPVEATIFNTTTAAQVEAAGYDLQGAVAGKAPGAQLLFSPRIGFNYDVKGDRTLVIRGGAGIFTSRVPFVWPGGMYTNNGVLLADLDARQNDIDNYPGGFAFKQSYRDQYTLADFGKTAGSSQLDLFAKDFKYPQIFRTSLAADFVLPFGMVGTVEGIFSKTLNNVVLENVNVTPSFGTLQGADNRKLYDGSKISGDYTDIIVASNTSEGSSYNFTAQVQKPYANGWVGSIAYTFGQSKSINDMTSSQNSSNWRFVQNVNGKNNVDLGYSNFDMGHRFTTFVSKRIEYGGEFGGATTLTLFYNAQSGQRFSYTYAGTLVNDDFADDQDLLYIPASASEINLVDDADYGTAAQQWAALDAFISGDDYLSSHRGQYAERNGARMPFTNIVDLKVMQDFFVNLGGKRRTLQVSLDIFNFTNMINKDWGRRYFMTNGRFRLIEVERGDTDTTADYKFKAPTGDVWNIDESGINSSLWQAQLGVRLSF